MKKNLNKKALSRGALSGVRFSKPHLVAFALIFAAIGGFFIYKSFAAGTSYNLTSSITDGATISGSVDWSVTVSPAPTKVEFYIDGVKDPTADTTAPYAYKNGTQLDTSTLSNGTHTLQEIATYASSSTVATHTVTVSNGSGTANLYVSPTGNDANSCTQSAPCQSLNRAYSAAQCGNTVNIASGSYPAETISSSKNCSTNPIIFKGSSPKPVFAHILFRASGVTVDGVSIPDNDFQTEEGTGWSNITVRNSSAYGFDFRGTNNLLLEGNTFDGEYTKNQNWMYNNNNFVIRNNTLTRYDDQRDPDNHSEAIYVAANNRNGLIENNQFIDNGRTGHLFFTWWGGSPPADNPHDICVQNNNFVRSHNSYYHIQFRQEISEDTANIYISPNNTFDNSAGPGPWTLKACPSSPNPPSPPTVSLTANPASVAPGAASTLSWSSTNATSCTASGAWSGSKATSGSQNVSPSATSVYSLSCTGVGGSATASTTVTVTTQPPPPPTDTVPPSTPQNQRQSANTPTSLTMAWSASTDNVGVAGYYVWLNGSQIASTTSLSYTYSGLTCGTTYTVGLQAYDAAGNRSSIGEATGPMATAACAPTKRSDLNGDNAVNILDLSILLSYYGTANTTADINKDGTVNVLDMSILLSDYGS